MLQLLKRQEGGKGNDNIVQILAVPILNEWLSFLQKFLSLLKLDSLPIIKIEPYYAESCVGGTK